jgi:hypothetical protein
VKDGTTMTAARRGVNRIKRSRYKTDDEFVGALRTAGKTKEADRYVARKAAKEGKRR